MRNRTTMVLALVLALSTLSTAAFAQEAEDAPASNGTTTTTQPTDSTEAQAGRVVLRGVGALHAKGVGRTRVHMAGVYRAGVKGNVVIRDHAGDLKAYVAGQLRDVPADGIVLRGFEGRIRLVGSRFSVTTTGKVHLLAKGAGKAVLTGRGVWETRNGRHGTWGDRDLTLDFVTD